MSIKLYCSLLLISWCAKYTSYWNTLSLLFAVVTMATQKDQLKQLEAFAPKSDMDQKTTVQMILQTGHHHNKPPLQPTEESHERVSREFKNVKQKRSHLFNSWILTRVGPFNRKMILSTLRNGWKRKNGMKYLNPFKCRGIWNQYCLQKPTKHTKCMHVCKAISI